MSRPTDAVSEREWTAKTADLIGGLCWLIGKGLALPLAPLLKSRNGVMVTDRVFAFDQRSRFTADGLMPPLRRLPTQWQAWRLLALNLE